MSSTVLFSFRSWWPIFLALLLVSGPLCASAEGDCFTSDGKEVKLSAKCTKANTTIKFSDKDKALNFKLEASQGDSIPLIRITLNIGGCEFHGDVSYGGVRNSLQLDKTANPDLPAHAKATSSGVTFSNPTYNVPDCTPKFVADGDGNLVNISYKADVELPNLQITFSDSQLYVAPEEKVDWSTGGWRLWTVIAAVVAVVLVIISIITFFIIKRCKNKKTDAKKGSTKSTSTRKKSGTKKSEKNTGTKISGSEDWIQNYEWPLNTYTEKDKQFLRTHLQGPNPPIRKLLRLRPILRRQEDAFNEWSVEHQELYANKDQLPIEQQRQLEADDKMFAQIYKIGKDLGWRKASMMF
ncbi:hypothetical protein M3Y95_01147800 [Aphelenchoides besseyi]|nr:hypothetical protein M3Y95_01147800 [Aphelenchoides besseyi]